MSTNLLRRATAPGAGGVVVRTDPADAGWRYLSFGVHRMAPGARIDRAGDGDEVLVLVLEGSATITAGNAPDGIGGTAMGGTWEGVGGRESVFSLAPAGMVLAAPGADVSIAAETAALVGVAHAPGGDLRMTRRIGVDEVAMEDRGSGQTARRVHHLLPPGGDRAGRLIAFEVYTPGGNWSSYPPHKHDVEDPPTEAYLEELYFYRFARPQGFAFARVYTPDRSLDEAMTPMDCDVVVVPRGYHPVGAPAGYDCYYLNVMAGDHRAWHFTIDPDHAWLMDWAPPAS